MLYLCYSGGDGMYNILICDDERDIRRALSIYLAGEKTSPLNALKDSVLSTAE